MDTGTWLSPAQVSSIEGLMAAACPERRVPGLNQAPAQGNRHKPLRVLRVHLYRFSEHQVGSRRKRFLCPG